MESERWKRMWIRIEWTVKRRKCWIERWKRWMERYEDGDGDVKWRKKEE